MPEVVFHVDQSKSMRDQDPPGDNRWHPDIPPVASVQPGSEFRVECREWTDAQLGSRLQVYAQATAGEGDLADPVTYAAYNIPEPLALGDLNGDGRRDVTTVHGGWQTFSVMLQRPDGRLGADYFYDLPYATHYDPRGPRRRRRDR